MINMKLLGRSKGQRELNPFLFQAELPPPFWHLIVLSSCMNMRERDEIMGGSANEGWLQIRENKCGISLPYPERAVTHSSTLIDKCIVYHPNVFVLVNKCSSQVKLWDLYSFSTTMSVINVLHTHIHPHNIRLGIKSSVRHLLVMMFRHPQT